MEIRIIIYGNIDSWWPIYARQHNTWKDLLNDFFQASTERLLRDQRKWHDLSINLIKSHLHEVPKESLVLLYFVNLTFWPTPHQFWLQQDTFHNQTCHFYQTWTLGTYQDGRRDHQPTMNSRLTGHQRRRSLVAKLGPERPIDQQRMKVTQRDILI